MLKSIAGAAALLIVVGAFALQSKAAAWWHRAQAPQLQQPAGWPQPHYDFADNPLTAAGFELGRRLFYDPQLSRDGSVSCGSCHQQFAAFAQLDHRVSHGVGGAQGKRNAPGLFNLAWQPDFMWDGAVHQLELQPLAPLQNPLEMDEKLDHVLGKLQADPTYRAAFSAAFGNDQVDSQRMLRALTQFIGTMVSANSRYDRYVSGSEPFSATEVQGLQVFRAHCASCHSEPLFTDFSYRNNGLDAAPRDPGRAGVTEAPADAGRFRVPSLRNVALTAPYMHDGRYATLDAVLDHYIRDIRPSATLDPRLAGGIALTASERSALLQFLDTLTDESFVHDPSFAERHE